MIDLGCSVKSCTF